MMTFENFDLGITAALKLVLLYMLGRISGGWKPWRDG